MICVAIHLLAKPGQEEAVQTLFQEYIPLVEKLPGVVRFELHRSRSEPRRFLLYELYNSYEALLAHRTDAAFAVWRPRIAALEESRQLEEFDTLIA